MKLEVIAESWAYARPFKIAYVTRTELPLVHVRITHEGITGQGEGIGVSYLGETQDSLLADLERARVQVEAGVDREALQEVLPPGGARNALDCALWDLAAKQSGKSVFELTGLTSDPVQSVYTISLDDPVIMAEQARTGPSSHLKIKLNAEFPVERVAAVRHARPDAVLVVDANQSWTMDVLDNAAPRMAALGVSMIEQPLAAGKDSALDGYKGPIPIGADESCQTVGDLEGLASGYSVINVKLDKTGGLTGALQLAREAKARGYDLMVGCMAGTSLSMAPAFVIAQMCRYVDIDGPLLLAEDRTHGLTYENGMVSAPDARLWG
jgi:L-alanine-DL-glutamate epimerase-like enolase superfamily enzyme